MENDQIHAFKSIFGVKGKSVNWITVVILTLSFFISQIFYELYLNIKWEGTVVPSSVFTSVFIGCLFYVFLPVLYFKAKPNASFTSFIILLPITIALSVAFSSIFKATFVYHVPFNSQFFLVSFLFNFFNSLVVFVAWYYLAAKKLSSKVDISFYLLIFLGVFSGEIASYVIGIFFGWAYWFRIIIDPTVFIVIFVIGDKLFKLYQPVEAEVVNAETSKYSANINAGNVVSGDLSIANKNELRALLAMVLPTDCPIKETKALATDTYMVEFGKSGQAAVLYWFNLPQAAPRAYELAKESLNGFFKSPPVENGIWKTYFKSKNIENGLTDIFYIGKGACYINSVNADKEEVVSLVSKVISELQQSNLQERFIANKPEIKQTMAGPIIGGVLLLLMGLLTIASGEEVYAFGRSSSVNMPNIIPALLFFMMATFCFFRKIRYTYYFVLFTSLITFIQVAAAASFGMSDSISAGGVVLLNSLLGIIFLIVLPVRSKDFGHFNAREFFSHIFSR